jgi:hypothetical protein
MMNEFEQKLHRTVVQFLVEYNCRAEAAIVIESELHITGGYSGPEGISLEIPTSMHGIVKKDVSKQEHINLAILHVSDGHITDRNGNAITLSEEDITHCIRLIEVEAGWQNVVRELIADAKNPNQAVVSEKMSQKNGKEIYSYNEMKFASNSEIRIAQELEVRKILFFPLPLAVRAESGDFYKDHREPDFLICHDGTWGILEVAYHPNRYEKDSEKADWFKQSGILCVQHYTAERCYNESGKVVDKFLEILAQHKK